MSERELPTGIYERLGKYVAKVWKDQKITGTKTFETKEEAEYNRPIMANGNHWEGLESPGPYFGFLYKITNKKNGKMYIGRKQFYKWAGPPGGFKCTDPTDEWWDPKAWVDNDWEFYTGSSQDLNEDIKKLGIHMFRFEVLAYAKDKLDLTLMEIFELIDRDVLYAEDENGEYVYYNKNIAGEVFRPPARLADVREAQAASEEAIRTYYLRPDLDDDGKVIPYPGKVSLATFNDPFPEHNGGFQDVR